MYKVLATILIIAGSSILPFLAGCQTDAQTGALIGSGAGAGIGQWIGRDTESTLIGAAVGAAAGYFLGNESDKQKAKTEMLCLREEMNYVTISFTNSNGSISQVRLRRQGPGYVGTRGEYYNTLPTPEQLRVIYGF